MIHTKPTATIADLYRVQEKAELVNGEIVIMSPAMPATVELADKSTAVFWNTKSEQGRDMRFPITSVSSSTFRIESRFLRMPLISQARLTPMNSSTAAAGFRRRGGAA